MTPAVLAAAPLRARSAGAGRPWVLSACYLLLYTGFSLSFPFMAIYLGQGLHVPLHIVGAYLSLCVLANAAGQAAGGRLSDRWGRRPLMVGSLAARGLCAALLAFAVARRSFAAVAAAQLLYSFLGAAFEPASRSWVADVYPPEDRLRVFSFIRIASNLGWAVGPALGSFFSLELYPRLFAVTAALCLVCAALVAASMPESLRAPDPETAGESRPGGEEGRTDGRFLLYCAWTAALAAVMAQLVVSLSLHATRFVGLGERQVGLLFSANGLLVVLSQAGVTSLFSAWPLTTALFSGSLLFGAGYAGVGLARGFAGLLAAVAVVSLAEVTVMPALWTLAANLAPGGERGRWLGLHGLAYQVGFAAGPLAGGWGLEHLSPKGPQLPWLAVAALAALSAFGFRSFGRRLAPEENLSDAPGGRR